MEIPKRIPLEGTYNTRDLGGYKTIDKRVIRPHRLLRSDALSKLTLSDRKILLDEYRLTYVIDFRGEKEIKRRPDPKLSNVFFSYFPITDKNLRAKETKTPPKPVTGDKNLDALYDFIVSLTPELNIEKGMEEDYVHFVSSPIAQSSLRRFFLLLKEQKKDAVLFHCADGKDRTGVATYLLLRLLGVDEKTAKEDYLLSNRFLEQKKKRREIYLTEECHVKDEKIINSLVTVAGVRITWLNSALTYIKEHYGSILSYAHQALSLTDEDIQKLQSNYLA